jgi:hypothetical protein
MSDPASDPSDPLLREDRDEPTWWRPDWKSAIGSVGYRWLAALAALALFTLIPLVVLFSGEAGPLAIFLIKLIVLFGVATVSLALYVLRNAVRMRHEPFCIFCGYNLSGLPDDYRCPECGRNYTFKMIDEYRSDPSWFIQRWRARQQLPPSDRPLDVPANAPRRRSRDGT